MITIIEIPFIIVGISIGYLQVILYLSILLSRLCILSHKLTSVNQRFEPTANLCVYKKLIMWERSWFILVGSGSKWIKDLNSQSFNYIGNSVSFILLRSTSITRINHIFYYYNYLLTIPHREYFHIIIPCV